MKFKSENSYQIKNPFGRFLHNIILGLILMLISLAGIFSVPTFFNSNKINQQISADAITDYLTFSSENTFTLNVYDNTKHWDGTLYYSTDAETWSEWSGTSTISSSTISNGKANLFLYGISNTKITGNSGSNYRWVLTGSNISCTGNIETLLDSSTVSEGNHPTMASGCFDDLFYNCTSLTTAPSLPATALVASCYNGMFYGCTNLTTAPTLPATTLASNCYGYMFCGCTALTAAPALPATTLAVGCYFQMFVNCTSLTTVPALPATNLVNNCYASMFGSCSSLKISATKTGEYVVPFRIPTTGTGTNSSNAMGPALDGMFASTGGAFTGTPSINTTYYTTMPLTGLDYPYLTFSSSNTFTLGVGNNTKNWDGTLYYSIDAETWNIWSGTTTISSSSTPVNGKYNLYLFGMNNTNIGYYDEDEDEYFGFVLTGTNIDCNGNIETLLDALIVDEGNHPTMAPRCFTGLFRNCSALKSAPSLPATTLTDSCYEYMFEGCTSLTIAPALLATTLSRVCYSSMFYGCTGLTTVPELPATTLAESCYAEMFYGCTSLTTAPALPATTLAANCYSDMFYGCTSLTTAPALPATTLAESCYARMFNGCTSLTTAPALPATTLRGYCYRAMFSGCTSLKISETQTAEYNIPYRVPTTGTGTTATDALSNMFASTGGTFTGTPEINTIYYTNNPLVGEDYITVTFDPGDGEVSPTTKQVANGYMYGTLPEPNKTGYTLGGWYKESTFDNLVTAETIVSTNQNHTLYVKWIPENYTITYKDEGDVAFSGTHVDTPNAHPTTHTYNTATTLNGATKTDYTFGGWFTTSTCTGSAVTTLGATEYTGDITLYAKWYDNTPYLSKDWSTTFTNSLSINKNQIGAITFTKTLPSGSYVNVSSTIDGENFDGLVKAYYTLNGTTNYYDISIYADGEVVNFPTSSDSMFSGLTSLTAINFGSSCIDTSSATSMASMFDGASSLTSLDLSEFDITSVASVSNMFNNTTGLRTLFTPTALNAGVSSITLANSNYYISNNIAAGAFNTINSSTISKTLKLGYTLNYNVNGSNYSNGVYVVDTVNNLISYSQEGYRFFGWFENAPSGDLTALMNNTTFDATGRTGTITLYGKSVKKGAKNVTGYSDDTITFNVTAPNVNKVYGLITIEYYDEDLETSKVNTYMLNGNGLTLSGLRYGTYKITITSLLGSTVNYNDIVLFAGYNENNEVNIIISNKILNGIYDISII